MADDPSGTSRQAEPAPRDLRRYHGGLLLFEGIVLLLLGTLALMIPAIAAIAATVFFGWLLLVSGVIGLITTMQSRHGPGFWWSFASALAGIIAGALLVGWPVVGTFSLTTVLIAFLFAEGFVSIMYALEHRKDGTGRWSWVLASGIADLVLAVVLVSGLPGTALWALGVIVGINMIFGGWALIAMALHMRGGAPEATS
jgi:uncharacterized membrane protein HdeD (DUF308 family)